MKSKTILCALAVCAVSVPLADAHFKLLEPASAVIEANLGDPQKAFQCGVSARTAGTPSNAVTQLKGGQKLHLKVQETVYHPGHYRVALAADRGKLPVDPKATTRMAAGRGGQQQAMSVSAEIEKEPKPPVLADGLWPHTSKPPADLETDLEIPNVSCPKCVIQVIQFMAEHGLNAEGDFSYHHCADVQITLDSSKATDKGWTDFLAAK
jgi:hypothetical protein